MSEISTHYIELENWTQEWNISEDYNWDFSAHVRREKSDRISNLSNVPILNTDNLDIDSYFKNMDIDLETLEAFMRNYMKDNQRKRIWEDLIIEWQLTQIEKWSWFQEVIALIEEKGPFHQPEELVQVISDLVKDNMSYDIFLSLSLIFRMSNYIDNKEDLHNAVQNMWIELTSQQMDDLDNLKEEWWDLHSFFYEVTLQNAFDNEAHRLTWYHLTVLKNILWAIDLDDLSQNYRNAVQDLHAVVDKNNIELLNNYFKDKLINNPDTREMLKWLLVELWSQMITSWTTKKISDRLLTEKIWVCRHFSVIAKHIFNEMLSSWNPAIQFDDEAEVIYVLNSNKWHAYNLLMYEWKDWEIHNMYFDITNYIMGGELFMDPKERNSFTKTLKDNEIFVKNQEITNKVYW